MTEISDAQHKKSNDNSHLQMPAVTRRDIMRFTWHYWRRRPMLGLSAAVFMLLSVVVESAVPSYTGRIVDSMSSGTAPSPDILAAAWAGFTGFCILSLLSISLRQVSVMSWNKFAVQILYDIVTEGLRKVQRFSSDWHANSFAGATVRKLTRGMWSFDKFEDTFLMGLLPAVTIMVGITAMLAVKLPLVGLIVGSMIVLYCAVSIWLSIVVLAPKFSASAAYDSKVGATLADIITGNPTVKSFAAEGREDSHFERVASEWRESSIHAWQVGQVADGLRSILRSAMMISMLGGTLWLWQTGHATPGDIVIVITSCFILGGYLRDIGMHISNLQRSASEVEDVVSFWMRQDDVVDAAGARALSLQGTKTGDDMIVFDSVSFKYPSTGKLIYEGMTVRIRAGESVALVGPSGSGKSTFVKLLQRLYNLHEGRILVAGQDIALATMDSLRQTVALVPQDPVLFHRSLAENIAYARPGASHDDIVAAARKAYAHDFIETLPYGYDTLVGERGVKLSGGERQRVAIARAILAQSPILIFDEATSSLDSISEHYIQKALEELTQGRTTITIAHRLSTVQRVDRILVFDQGRIIEQGSHAELMATPGSRYKMLYETQMLDLVA